MPRFLQNNKEKNKIKKVEQQYKNRWEVLIFFLKKLVSLQNFVIFIDATHLKRMK